MPRMSKGGYPTMESSTQGSGQGIQSEVLESVPEEIVSVLEAALGYALRGWRCFPVRGKLPLVMWQDEATTDTAQVNRWFGGDLNGVDPTIGVAICTGNGLVVLDVDAAHGGLESLSALFAEYPNAVDSDTPVVRTGGGGLHFYFSTATELRNKTGVRPGIDIRGDGGYVVAPPSPHASGKNYAWQETSDTLAPWPFDLHKEEPAPVVSEEGIPSGQRNSVLTSLAGTMRRRGMTELAIREALLVTNMLECHPPLPDNEVKAIAKSIMRYAPEDPATSLEQDTMAVTAPQFVSEVVETPVWLVESVWMASAIGFVLGPPKVYKSFLALEMGAAVANGKPFLGVFRVPEPRVVLLVQKESSRVAFKERVKRVMKAYGSSENLHVLSNRPFDLDTKLGYEMLKMEVARLKPALLILDPLSSFVRGDQNDAQAMGEFLRPLVNLRNEYDMAICVVHHSKKGAPKEFRGSSTLFAASEVTIRMYRFADAVHRSHVTFELKDEESPDGFDVAYQQSTGILAAVTPTKLLAMALEKGKVDKNDEPSYNR